MKRYLALQKIVEFGSFSKAASSMGYTQSALSQMIASLEDELHIKLLNRYRTGAKLTYEGKKLYPDMLALINAYHATIYKSEEILGLETGIVRFGVLTSISVHWLPRLIRSFEQLYPKVEFVIHSGDYTSIEKWIRTGEVDFGFVNPNAVSGLQTDILGEGRMLAILPKNHPLAKASAVPLSALAKEPYILLEEGHYYEPLEAFHRIGTTPKIKYTIHDDYTIMTMVEAGLGVSMLAELILQRTHYNIAIRETTPPVSRILSIAYKSKDDLPTASRLFIHHIKDMLDYFVKPEHQLPET